MKVKLEWLNELVDLNGLTIDEIVEKVSLYSVEIEGYQKVVDGSNLVIGKVLSKVAHPDSDHLNVCMVDVGKEKLQIVCGAPNVIKDQTVIVALVGATLPNGLKIKQSKIRGVESNGMICSLEEIGMDKKYIPEEYENGIYYFTDERPCGADALKELSLDDYVLDLSITPNRADLLSVLGVAIEFSAVFNRPLKELTYDLIKEKEKTTDHIKVKSETNSCLAYYAQVVKDVVIKPSPWWLKARLIAFGIRTINNVVDITNYILALFGQPLHAFDMDKLTDEITIRMAKDKEEFITLDKQTRSLLNSDIVITDGKRPIALAGVMGGYETEVINTTKNLVIEAAVFEPKVIRKTSSRLFLRSESSIRYERGVDLNRTRLALDYACFLLKTLANGKVYSDYAFTGISEIKDTVIDIDEHEVNKLLGITISKDELINIYNRLGFKTNIKDKITVYVPNRRADIKIKADLIEEAVRIYGYSKMKETLPYSALYGGLNIKQQRERLIKRLLKNNGLKEVISHSLLNNEQSESFGYLLKENAEPVTLMNPLSEDRKYLRRSLLTGLLEIAKYNNSRKVKDIAIFEIGKTYYMLDNKPIEEETLGLLLTNKFTDTMWNGTIETVDFYLVKGIVDIIFNELNITCRYRPIVKTFPEIHPKRSAEILLGEKVIGYIGELHPKLIAENNFTGAVIVTEIKLNDLYTITKEEIKYKPIFKTPTVERDIAIVIKKDVLAGDIHETLKRNKDKYMLDDIKIFDCYIGDKIAADEKSIAIKLSFISNDVLTDEIVNNKITKILKQLEINFGAALRK